MPATILLPSPTQTGRITIGQILSDPLNPDVDSYINVNDALPLRTPQSHKDFTDTISYDDFGRFITRKSHPSKDNTIQVQADQMSYTTLRDPLSAFRYTSRRASSQAYLHKAALERRPLYFVTAIQTLTNPRFMDNLDTPTSIKSPIRRQDSGISLNEQDGNVVFALELRKVFCRIGSPDEPQRPSDIGYVYKHYRLQGEEELQLAVGLGPVLGADEFINLLGSSSDSDYTDESVDSDAFDDDEDEGCMCCASSISNASYRRY